MGTVSGQTAKRLAWGLVVVTVALFLAGLSDELALGAAFDLSSAFIWVIGLVFSVVGALIATRQPGNAIGWIFSR